MLERRSKIALLGVSLVALAILTALIAGPGYQMGWWGLRVGLLSMLTAAMAGALLGGVLCLIGAIIARPGRPYRGFRSSLLGLLLVLVMLIVLGPQVRTAFSVPPIHDITTDTQDPPQFVELLAARKAAPNGADYAGPELAEQQQKAYPDIQPIKLAESPEEAFAKALAAVRQLGWEIAAHSMESGRIEATERSFWFGFADDIVIRIRLDGTGSRIDLRSMSRVGKSDVGVNAARIRRFRAAVEGDGKAN